MDSKITNSFSRFCNIAVIMSIPKTILLLILFQTGHETLFAQKIIDSVSVCEYPVRAGVIYLTAVGTAIHCGEPGVAILTNSDSVFCAGNGLIIGIHSYGDGCAIVIRTEKDDYVSYSNLKSSGLCRGDVVQKGTFLGFAGISDNERSRQVNVMILDKNAKYFSIKKLLERIRCNASCEEPKGYIL
jgi:hypothetical protein